MVFGIIMRPYIPGIMPRTWYTQREWDRVVGWGKVPKEYSKIESGDEDEQENRSVDEDTAD